MDVPELTSFAAVVRFALGLEERAATMYESPASRDLGPVAAELAAQHRDRARRIERARQQFLNEVVLEPVQGLDAQAYVLPGTSSGTSAAEQAMALEEASARFYGDSAESARPVLVEMTRTFRRLAEGNRENVARLRGLGRPS